jgi:hypothetical protein
VSGRLGELVSSLEKKISKGGEGRRRGFKTVERSSE